MCLRRHRAQQRVLPSTPTTIQVEMPRRFGRSVSRAGVGSFPRGYRNHRFTPEIGVTSTPVIDRPAGGLLGGQDQEGPPMFIGCTRWTFGRAGKNEFQQSGRYHVHKLSRNSTATMMARNPPHVLWNPLREHLPAGHDAAQRRSVPVVCIAR